MKLELDNKERIRILGKTLELAKESCKSNNYPFGAIIYDNNTGEEIEATNSVSSSFDITAHAEVNCIRKACKELEKLDLSTCEIYASSEPCPMCLSAIYWSGIRKVYYVNDVNDTSNYLLEFQEKKGYNNMTDQKLYDLFKNKDKEIDIEQIKIDNSDEPFKLWLK